MKQLCLILAPLLILTACSSTTNTSNAIASPKINKLAFTNAPYRKEIQLPQNGHSVTLTPNFFKETNHGKSIPNYPTKVTLSYDKATQSLKVRFENLNDLYVEQNQYQNDNTEIWNQEVFEMFITPDSAYPGKYVEIEVNPNGTLFSAHISNPTGQTPEGKPGFFNGKDLGMVVHVNKKSHSWSGSFTFPLKLAGELSDSYKVNFFRVVALKPHDESSSPYWACGTNDCEYLAWNPTYSGQPPAFHRPAYFATLHIKP